MNAPDPKLAVVFFGRPSLMATRVFEAIARRHRIVAVVESQRRGVEARRGSQRWLKKCFARHDIERMARRASVPYFLLTPERTTELATLLASLAADVAVIARMAQLLPQSVIDAFPQGVLNVHPSLLPAYRGPAPLFWPYFHEARCTGVSVHFVDANEDTGDIVKQAEIPMIFGELASQLEARCVAVAPTLVMQALDDIAHGAVLRQSQRELPCPFRARYLQPGEQPIPWNDWPIERVYHTLRGADGRFELLPSRGFPLNLCRWRPVSFEKGMGSTAGPTIERSGMRYFVTHRDGRIFLRPILSLSQARHALRSLG